MRTAWVPGDAAARSVGADQSAAALEALGVRVKRPGSRGLLWLEPLIEVETDRGRVGYAAPASADLPRLLEDPPAQTLALVEDHPWLRHQERLTFARVGVIEPCDLAGYLDHGGYAGLRRALGLSPERVVAEVTTSGLRGRGGAGFPTGVKWETVRAATGDKVVVANADEGDSGTFADRMLMEGDPFSLIEGMTIAGWAVGAKSGTIYIRSEYPDSVRVVNQAIDIARSAGWLGANIQGSGCSFEVEVRVGAGAYICGEETSMLNSLEGKRGEVRAKPPIPAVSGLFGQPTVVNNVLTLATLPAILTDGGEAYAAYGTGRSRGTQVFQLAGNIAQGGIVEVGFGITLGELVEGFGGGTRSGRPVKAVQVGGPLGAYLTPKEFGVAMDYESLAAVGGMLGHGGIVVFDDTMNAATMARFAMEFCARESCGKCTPCRIGSTRGVELVDRLTAGDPRAEELLLGLCTTMEHGSLCAMGGLTPMPVRSALRQFAEDFAKPQGAGR